MRINKSKFMETLSDNKRYQGFEESVQVLLSRVQSCKKPSDIFQLLKTDEIKTILYYYDQRRHRGSKVQLCHTLFQLMSKPKLTSKQLTYSNTSAFFCNDICSREWKISNELNDKEEFGWVPATEDNMKILNENDLGYILSSLLNKLSKSNAQSKTLVRKPHEKKWNMPSRYITSDLIHMIQDYRNLQSSNACDEWIMSQESSPFDVINLSSTMYTCPMDTEADSQSSQLTNITDSNITTVNERSDLFLNSQSQNNYQSYCSQPLESKYENDFDLMSPLLVDDENT